MAPRTKTASKTVKKTSTKTASTRAAAKAPARATGARRKPAAREGLDREEWIRAARTMLIKHGVAAVKVDKLARELGVTRGGFYWRFKGHADLLDALLDDWQRTNTTPWLNALAGEGSPAERFQALIALWIEEKQFSPDYDSAIREWSRVSSRVARVVHAVDERRIEALKRMFLDAGFNDDEAFVRARITYFHQVGYYAMGLRESAKRRYQLSDLYNHVLTGFV